MSSGSLRGALTFGLGGAGFAVGNILLAAALPPEQFGLVSLILALHQFGLSSGPLGLDIVIKRHRPRLSASLLRSCSRNALLVALVITLAAQLIYDLERIPAALVFTGATLAAGNNVVYGIFQSRGEQAWALGLAQLPNWVLLLIAIVALAVPVTSSTPLLLAMVLGYAATTLIGWLKARRGQDGLAELDAEVAFREGLASVSIGLALQLLWQLERVTIPKLLTVEDLATFAVLATVVAAPFRVTQIGVAFTLIEKLRSAPDASHARSVLRRESWTAAALVVGAVLAVLIAKPLVFHYLLNDKYVVGPGLVAATIAVGAVRVAESFSTTSVTAFGSEADLARMSTLAWASLVVAGVASVLLSVFGLVGIVLAALLGWLTLFGGGTVLAVRSFRRRFSRGPDRHERAPAASRPEPPSS